jgi:NAD(P)H-dependent FMN reductase
MTRILGISGSLREHSYNSALLRAAVEMFPDQLELGEIAGIPLFNGDVEQAGVPQAVLQLKQQLLDADGLLLVSPEYNHSMPGVLKNVVDWLSRPSLDVRNAFRDKPVALIGASPGGFGTVLSQNAWLPVFRALGARFWSGGRLLVSHAGRVFDEQGSLQDEQVRQRLEEFVGGFIDFCRE